MLEQKILLSVGFALTFVALGESRGLWAPWRGPYYRGYAPACGDGPEFFADFMKCDASLHYCFEYNNASCVGPDNWVCVHNLNKKADLDIGSDYDLDVKNKGYGNTRCCGGKYQSPINIPASDAHCTDLLTPIYYVNPDVPYLKGTYENSGYYSKFFVPAEEYTFPLALANVPFRCAVPGHDFYVFTNVHVHAGIKDKHGSAHFVDGKHYDGEFHLVHYRGDFWRPGKLDARCASQTPMGLAVIGVFLSLTEGETNEEVNRMLSHENLEQIRDSHVECPYDDICDLDDDDKKHSGSKSSDSSSRRSDGDDDDDKSKSSDSSSRRSDGDDDDKSKSSGSSSSSSDDDDDKCEDIDDRRGDGDGRGDRRRDRGDNDIWRYGGDDERDNGHDDSRHNRDDYSSDGDDYDDRRRKRDTDGWKKRKTWKSWNWKGGKRVACFCERWKYTELSVYSRGEELQCFRKYRGGFSLDMEDSDSASATKHVECNQHANGEPCGDGIVERFELRPGRMLPSRRDYWQYFGSLTTPPCSEVVNWMVMKQPIRITKQQLDDLHKLESRREDVPISKYGDVRPLQPLNGRPVFSSQC